MSRLLQEHIAWLGMPRVNRTHLTANSFMQPFLDRRGISIELARALSACRKVCKNPDVDQYVDDIKEIMSGEPQKAEVQAYLDESDFDMEDDTAWYARADELGYVRCGDEIWRDRDEVWWCDHKEAYYTTSNEVYVASSSTENWCDEAVEQNAFYCDYSERTYSGNHFNSSRTDDGRAICEEVANEYDFYYSEHRECYSRDSDDEDDDEDDDENSIPAYHDADRTWNYNLANKSTRAWYGIELECDLPGSTSRYDFWNEHLSDNPDFCGERDGSLNDERGLEIITRPFSLHELHQPDNVFAKLVKALNEAKGSANYTNYGIHVTSNVGRLFTWHKKRLVQFIAHQKRLVVAISGRENQQYANFGELGAKHSALCFRHVEAYELRTFKSTTDWSRILSYVEFYDAVVEYVRDPEHLIEGPLAASLFRAWVKTQNYPNLIKRLVKQDLTAPCALPLSSLQTKPYPNNACAPASPTTQTAPDLLTTVAMDVSRSIRAFSTWTNLSQSTTERRWIITNA